MANHRFKYTILTDQSGYFYLFRNHWVLRINEYEVMPDSVYGPYPTIQDFINDKDKHGGNCIMCGPQILTKYFRSELKDILPNYIDIIPNLNKWIGKYEFKRK